MQSSHTESNDDQKKDHNPVYSSRNTTHDYLTLRGIELRTQVTVDEIYTACLSEMLDNSCGYMETHGVSDPQVNVKVSITPLNKEKSLVNIIVRNSVNPGSNHVFSRKLLELISKRIALLNTRGFLVEYASKLAKLANEKGCNISIIVDWDVSGILIYLKVKKIIPSIKRIRVDFETLRDLGLNAEDVEEKYEATKNKHFGALKKELEEALEYAKRNGLEEDIKEFTYLQNNLDYLEEKRIEINSITAQLNDNAKFWAWSEDKLRFWFPDRDFTRSASVLEYVEPDVLKELNEVVRQKGITALKLQREELLDKLANNNIENAFLFCPMIKQ